MYDRQCASGSCALTDGASCGVCAQLVPENGDCSNNAVARPALCSPANHCVPFPSRGQSCTGNRRVLQSAFRCNNGRCEDPLPLGASCGGSWTGTERAIGLPGECAPPSVGNYVCVQKILVSTGSALRWINEEFPECGGGSFCNAQGVCERLPDRERTMCPRQPDTGAPLPPSASAVFAGYPTRARANERLANVDYCAARRRRRSFRAGDPRALPRVSVVPSTRPSSRRAASIGAGRTRPRTSTNPEPELAQVALAAPSRNLEPDRRGDPGRPPTAVPSSFSASSLLSFSTWACATLDLVPVRIRMPPPAPQDHAARGMG